MKIFILSLLVLTSANAADTKLLMIGGGARPPEAMDAFVQASGGNKANIVICSWASASTEGAENIKSELQKSNPASITILPVFQVKNRFRFKTKTLRLIQSASGFFFTGGNQNQLMKAIQLQNLKQTLKDAYANGVVFAGTSAGTAIMSERMITGTEISPLSEGLGLLPFNIIVDQHFIVRQRFNRLAQLVLNNDYTFGIGIDEGTSLFIENNNSAQVIGPSATILFTKLSDQKISAEYFNQSTGIFTLPH